MKKTAWTASLLLASAFALAFAAASANYVHDPGVFASGAETSASPAYYQRGSLGQLVTGVASSANYIHVGGFDAVVSNGGGGSVLDSDAFASGPGPNWTIVSGTWTVAAGQLQFSAGAPGTESIRSNGPQTANAWIEVKVRAAAGTPVAAVVFRAQSNTLDGNNQYWVELDYAAGQVRFRKDVAGVESTVANSPFTFAAATTYLLRVKFAGDDVRVLLDGTQRICVSDASVTASGYYGLQSRGGVDVSFDDWNVVTASNSVPVANAGLDQGLTGAAPVLLNGTGSADGDGDPLNFTWTQSGGPAVTLSNATSAAPTFNPMPGLHTYTFQLAVDDCLNVSATDSVAVTVDNQIGGGGGGSGGGGGGGGCGLTGLEAVALLALLRRRR